MGPASGVLPSLTLLRPLERSKKTASINKVAPPVGVARNFIAPTAVLNPGNPGLGSTLLDRLKSFTFSLKVRGFLPGSWIETGIR